MSETGLEPAFAKQVRDALTHLLDSAHLQNHPLLPLLVPPTVTDPKARAQALREAVLRAIADLRPPADVSPREPAYRPYAILRHKYTEGFSAEDIQRRLAISRRQFFREQYRACEAVAGLLWERRIEGGTDSAIEQQALSDELEQIGLQSQSFALADTALQAIAAARNLANTHGVALSLAEGRSPTVFADEAVARQAIVSLLSALVKLTTGRYLQLGLQSDDQWAIISVEGLGRMEPAPDLEARLASVADMAHRVAGRLEVGESERGATVRLLLPLGREGTVAIVDDNPRTLRLFQRYLESYRYRLMLIQDSHEAWRAISEARPDVVVLDVMMRDIDGWQVLQALKAAPETRDIPVIICSVLDEGELAGTIGADGYLRKPVTQSELVQALAQARALRTGAPGR